MPDVSIAISAQDNFSTAIARMQNATRSFSKDAEGLDRKMTALNRNRATLSVDVRDARNKLREAQEAYEDLMEAGNATAEAQEAAVRRIVNATEDYDRARQNMSLLNREISNTRREMDNLYSSQERNENRMAGRSNSNSRSGVLTGFAAQMIGQEAQNLVSSFASSYLTSYYGNEIGNLLNSTFTSGISGITAGAMVGGAPGALVGGTIGALSGAIGGALNNNASKDEFYKNYIKSQYDSQQEKLNNSLIAGTTLAGGREVDRLSFTTLLGGDSDKAENFLKSIVDFANSTPFQYDDLTSMSKTLLTYKYSEDEMMSVLQNIGDAGAALGMDTQNMNMVATGLGRMRSSGKTSLEYINLLQERGIDAIGALAEAHGITNAKVYESISKSLFDGAESAEIISKYMEKNYGGSMLAISETYNGLLSTFEGLNSEIDNAMGEGFTNARKPQLERNIEALNGETGDMMKEMYSQIGAFQAELENTKEQLEIDVFESLNQGNVVGNWSDNAKASIQELAKEYKELKVIIDNYELYGTVSEDTYKKALSESGRIAQEAKVIAENEYLQSDGYNLLYNSNIELAERIQENSIDSFEKTGWELGEVLTTGLERSIQSRDIRLGLNVMNEGYMDKSAKTLYENADAGYENMKNAGKKAFGMSYVPYNGYPTFLDEGERVLTASENRNYSNNQNRSNIVISGNNFTVRNEKDIDNIAIALLDKIEKANKSYSG